MDLVVALALFLSFPLMVGRPADAVLRGIPGTIDRSTERVIMFSLVFPAFPASDIHAQFVIYKKHGLVEFMRIDPVCDEPSNKQCPIVVRAVESALRNITANYAADVWLIGDQANRVVRLRSANYVSFVAYNERYGTPIGVGMTDSILAGTDGGP